MNTIAHIDTSTADNAFSPQQEKFQLIPHSADNCLLIQKGTRQWQIDFSQHTLEDNTWLLTGLYGSIENTLLAGQLMDQLFAYTKAQRLIISEAILAGNPVLRMPHWRPCEQGVSIERVAFYQIREHWLSPELLSVAPDARVKREGVAETVPVRPQIPDTVLYQRQIPGLNEVFSLRRATIEEDGERFHRWQNEPRVAKFWEYPFSRQELDDMLRDRRADPHCEPLIGCFDGQPFAYFESYWGLEDRLGPYYDARPFDHGYHVLVGEPKYLGGGRTLHWINALSHYLFLLDPRTERLVGEPRADNSKLLKWVEHTAWYKEREFDFPHKRAALLKCEREEYFSTTVL
ncbi:GNAT family N-acetyltransferase [Hahella sp. CCB-MM4]|uniref:GNAT family N-acetyltransferase n=1 Tax=Hahella sp. (strain CCB-MM4) TaxID=1926491 RepID=UPI000B9A2EF2|nr:GNAT family N-acetyltransferase [Hahella sp. CCB-MM4]OZG73138.1 GNAT family N-acetyltransferase [Hahella sp. CCB-MM4]